MPDGPITNCVYIDGLPILQADIGVQNFSIDSTQNAAGYDGIDPTDALAWFTLGAPPPPENCFYTGQNAANHGPVVNPSWTLLPRVTTIPASSPVWAVFLSVTVRIDAFSDVDVTVTSNGVPGLKTDLVTPSNYNFLNATGAPVFSGFTVVFLTVPGTAVDFDWSTIDIQVDAVQSVNAGSFLDIFGAAFGVYYGVSPAVTVAEFLEDPSGSPTDYDDTEMMVGGITMGSSYLGYLSKDISGIYTLVANKRDDTVYVRAGSTLTQDVQIPNPFAELGFTECDDE